MRMAPMLNEDNNVEWTATLPPLRRDLRCRPGPGSPSTGRMGAEAVREWAETWSVTFPPARTRSGCIMDSSTSGALDWPG
jgi:hypothetical protein